MAVELQYLGVVAETTGKTSEFIEFKGSKTEILDLVKGKYPGIKNLSFVVSRNGTVTHYEVRLEEGDQIALIPPAPGG